MLISNGILIASHTNFKVFKLLPPTHLKCRPKYDRQYEGELVLWSLQVFCFFIVTEIFLEALIDFGSDYAQQVFRKEYKKALGSKGSRSKFNKYGTTDIVFPRK